MVAVKVTVTPVSSNSSPVQALTTVPLPVVVSGVTRYAMWETAPWFVVTNPVPVRSSYRAGISVPSPPLTHRTRE